MQPQAQATVSVGRETFDERARRVTAERSAQRRAKLLEYLQNPVIVAEDVEALNSQANSIYLAFKPRNGWQDWLTSEIAVIMVRINRCTRIERRMREYAGYRAIDFWEDDQKVQVETLALKIHRDPARTVAKLRLTPVGCDWLAELGGGFLSPNEPKRSGPTSSTHFGQRAGRGLTPALIPPPRGLPAAHGRGTRRPLGASRRKRMRWPGGWSRPT